MNEKNYYSTASSSSFSDDFIYVCVGNSYPVGTSVTILIHDAGENPVSNAILLIDDQVKGCSDQDGNVTIRFEEIGIKQVRAEGKNAEQSGVYSVEVYYPTYYPMKERRNLDVHKELFEIQDRMLWEAADPNIEWELFFDE